jgi:hypothetical protein
VDISSFILSFIINEASTNKLVKTATGNIDAKKQDKETRQRWGCGSNQTRETANQTTRVAVEKASTQMRYSVFF